MSNIHLSPRIGDSSYKERGEASHLKEIGMALGAAVVGAVSLVTVMFGVKHDTTVTNPVVKSDTEKTLAVDVDTSSHGDVVHISNKEGSGN